MKKNLYGSLAFLSLLSTGAQALDYQIHGGVELFSKVGFNNNNINVAKNIYPTESFVTMAGSVTLDMQFLPQSAVQKGHTLNTAIGFALAGAPYDSTKFAPGGTQLFNYVGYNAGYFGTGMQNNQNIYFLLHNAYVDYNYKNPDGTSSFEFKGGRYLSSAQFHSGYTQGFEFNYRNKGLNLWWFSSWGRAFAFGEWFYEWYAVKSVFEGGKNRSYGIHAFKPSYTFENGLYVSPFVYFSPKTFTTPILELGYDTNAKFKSAPDAGYRSKTQLLYMHSFWNERLWDSYRYAALRGKGGDTLALIQTFYINNYNVGFGYYGNFGNANADFGTYGNAFLPFDFWTNTVYDIGAAINNAVTRDAQTGYIFGGGVHGNFSWNLLGRATWSPRADEQSVILTLDYALTERIKLWLALQWQLVTTHAGYVITSNNGLDYRNVAAGSFAGTSYQKLSKDSAQDRSGAFLSISYNF